jgi:DNA-binding MarR family transcriptional regulator
LTIQLIVVLYNSCNKHLSDGREQMKDQDIPIREFRTHLRVLEREVGLTMAMETDCCGVTAAQCHILMETEQRGCTSVTELASLLELDKSTLSRAVDAMCRMGLLDRQVDSCCRRQQVIRLTDKGREKADTINALCDASYTRLFDFIPEQKRLTVLEAAGLLAEAMRQKRKNPDAPCCVGKTKEWTARDGRKTGTARLHGRNG